MARGSLIVAYDAPTMNEYVQHGTTGWLFGPVSSSADSGGERSRASRRASYEAVVSGRQLWESRETEILDFVESAPSAAMRSGQLKVGVVRALKRIAVARQAIEPFELMSPIHARHLHVNECGGPYNSPPQLDQY